MSFQRILRRGAMPLLVPALVLVSFALNAGGAQAGRPRPLPLEERTPSPSPAAPEPTAAIVFGLGVGVVAWAARRARSK